MSDRKGVLQNASKLGFITSVDVVSEESDRFARVVLPALPFLDIMFLNEFEAGQALSVKIRHGDQIDVPVLLKSAETLLAAGVRRWVIIHFPEGALAMSRDGRRLFQPSLKVPPTGLQARLVQAMLLPRVFCWDTTMIDPWKIAWFLASARLLRPYAIPVLPEAWKILAPAWRLPTNLVIATASYRSFTRRWTSLSQ
jgi:hypothetical protein